MVAAAVVVPGVVAAAVVVGATVVAAAVVALLLHTHASRQTCHQRKGAFTGKALKHGGASWGRSLKNMWFRLFFHSWPCTRTRKSMHANIMFYCLCVLLFLAPTLPSQIR